MKRRLAFLALATLTAGPALAQQLPDIRTITVPAGGTTVAGKLADTKARSLFYVQGAAGQSMNVLAVSPENNVVFQVWEPGASVRTGSDDNLVLNGKAPCTVPAPTTIRSPGWALCRPAACTWSLSRAAAARQATA